MKLRLRPFQSKETLNIEVPNSSTLPQLLQILSESLSNSPSPASIRLSLNRKEVIRSDGADSLQSLGIAAGDLIYFSIEGPAASTIINESMEVDDDDIENNRVADELFDQVVDKSFSVAGFLRKVFAAELGDHDGRDHKLTVIAVHAVMVESGFVGFDEREKAVVDGFQLRNEWPSGLFRVSLSYTLRESVGGGGEAMKRVVLKFQSLGNYLSVYGTLVWGCQHFGVRLNEYELVPFLNAVWANCGVDENVRGKNGETLSTSPEKEVFRFWRCVKENLALPLLDDLRVEAGLEVPPYFMRLPSELKLKILESLPGEDVAKARCVCSELRDLGSSDEMWKAKCGEEFGVERKEAHESWKTTFLKAYNRVKVRRLAISVGAPADWTMLDWYMYTVVYNRSPRFLDFFRTD